MRHKNLYCLMIILLAAFLLCALISAHAKSTPDVVTLVKEGSASAALVLSAEPHKDELLAAQEIQDHIKQISGADQIYYKLSAELTE